jgi:hypothetical protein
MRYRCLLIAASLLMAGTTMRPAVAIMPFYNVFKKEYLDDHPKKEFVEEVTKASNRCLVCHQGKNRKHRNAFGQELAKLLDKKKDAKDTEKISASIKKVLAMHVDPKDEKSETYLDRVKAGKWPAGELEDLRKEPKEPADGDKK